MCDSTLDSSCTFCQIITGDEPAEVNEESDDFIAFADAFPRSEGHTLVCPKTHVERIENLDSTVGFFEFVDEVHDAILEEYNPKATKLQINNGRAAGQAIPHVHCHIIPRY